LLKIETEEHENRLLTMTVEVDAERVDRARRAAARRISQRANIPGFRKGKAPYEVVRRQFGDGAIYEEAVEDLGQQVYKEALGQAEIDPISSGSLEDVKLDPMVITYSVPLRPVVDLGDYRDIRHKFKPGVVVEEEFNDQLEHLREHQAVIDPVDRPARLGDIVVVNVAGHLIAGADGNDEKPFLLDDKNVSTLLEEETDWPAPGFLQHFAGMLAGEEKGVDYTFPDEYANEELRGKAAHFDVQVLEVKSRILPEWSDSLAQSIGDFESLLDLRLKLREQLQQRTDREADQAYAREVLDRVVAGAKVTFPQVVLDAELEEMLEDLDSRLREQGMTLQDYFKIQNTNREKVIAELEPQARERLKRSLVLTKLIEVEDLAVNDSDVDAQAEALSAPFGENREKIHQALRSDRLRQGLALNLHRDRAVDRLVAIANGENPASEPIVEPGPALEGQSSEEKKG